MNGINTIDWELARIGKWYIFGHIIKAEGVPISRVTHTNTMLYVSQTFVDFSTAMFNQSNT